MTLNQADIGKWYRILGVPRSNPCQNCVPCIKLRIMEMGFMPDETIMVESKLHGLWKVKISNGSTIAIRDNEVELIKVEPFEI